MSEKLIILCRILGKWEKTGTENKNSKKKQLKIPNYNHYTGHLATKWFFLLKLFIEQFMSIRTVW